MTNIFQRGLAFIVLLLLATTAHANLINGDFEDFAAWQGALVDSETLDRLDVDPSSYGSNFSIVGDGTAELSNSFDYFEVSIRQEFFLALDAAAVAFDMGWSLTSDSAGDFVGFDFVQAILFDALTGIPLVDLLTGTDTSAAFQPLTRFLADVSGLAGRSVILEFLLQDGDFDESDSLRFGNLEILRDTVIGVPEPPTVALMLLGLLSIRLGYLRSTSSPLSSA